MISLLYTNIKTFYQHQKFVMGWKSFRDRFQITKHMLEVDGDKLIISSCGTPCFAVVLMETGEVHPHPIEGKSDFHFPIALP